ncbi:hypothetical protein [Hyalangium versicolor]|uniref:hypothetical protein n=1 Tax=Hyalangium versicolor TaxID=2861190 RepID=UPI001CCF1C96|nr:hypothetical protein [Hyalangium versicolor]
MKTTLSINAPLCLLTFAACLAQPSFAQRYEPGQIKPEPTPLQSSDTPSNLAATKAATAGAVTAGGTGLGWETAFVEGTADFLVERAEGELSTVLMVRIGKQLCGADKTKPEEKPAERRLLPETCRLMDTYWKDPTQLLGPLFISAVRSDVEMLPPRMLPAEGAALVDVLWYIARESRKGRPTLQLAPNA